VADVLKAATGVNLDQKAFSRNEPNMPLYFLPVGAPGGQFGDGSDQPIKSQTVNLMRRLAEAYKITSPASARWSQWWAAAAQVETELFGGLFSYPYGDDSVPKRPPFELPSSRWQKDVGWVAMHSSLYDPERMSLFFKSSPYGSYNHSHADQNSFTINAFGEKLAIDAGYYDGYGTPFHTNYYRTTLAHNAITYDGNKGQKIHDLTASGRIAGFASSQAFDGTVGDATAAYQYPIANPNAPPNPPGLDLARRGIIYVKPNAFVVIDKLDAKGSSSVPFEYWLHADSGMTVGGQEATITKNQAKMKVQIQYPSVTGTETNTDFKDASGNIVTPNINPPEPLQIHTKFTFPSAASQTIISTYQPYRVGSTPSAIATQHHTTYQSLAFADGTMVYVRLSGSGLVTVNNLFKFDGMAAVVRGNDVLLLDGVRLEKDGVALLQTNVPATIALSGSEISISGDAPQLQVQVNTTATTLIDETYAAVTANETDGMKRRGVHWSKSGNVMTINSESGRHFWLSSMSAPGAKPNETLTVKRSNGTLIGTYSLAAHGTYYGGTASYGQLTGFPAGTYTIVSAPSGLIFEKEGAATAGTAKTLGASPWVILNGAGGELVVTN
jgi:hypothetical protein